MTRILSYLFGIFILATVFSCSSDDSKSNDDDDSLANVVVSSKVETSTSTAVDPADDNYTSVYTTPLEANKYMETAREFYTNDVLTETSIEIQYVYNSDGFLTNKNTDNTTFSREYFYDANNVVIAGDLYVDNGAVLNYRFVSQPNNIYFHERISLPHTDPATEIIRRIIIELNDDGQVISAGKDSDLDGVIDSVRTFTYSDEGNLLTVTEANETVTISYTDIIDTENYIQNEMIGLNNISIINGELYGFLAIDNIYDNSDSYNLSTQEAAEATYEVNEAGFYTKIIYPEDPHGAYINSRTVEYLFAN